MHARRLPVLIFALAALALFAPEAMAWGLQSHVVLADTALATLRLTDPALRQAVLAHPALVLAGACLPDLFLAGRALGTPAFRRSHRWSTLRRIVHCAVDPQAKALVVGYATHLLADVVAHNDFVPEHEARIARVPHATHALAEWAMDEHLLPRAPAKPRELLLAGTVPISAFLARAFRCDEALARRTLHLLAGADHVLRASPVPRLCRSLVRLLDRRLTDRFERYAARATARLCAVEAALGGAFRDWEGLDPEGKGGDQGADRRAREHIARIVQSEHYAGEPGE